MFLDAPSAKTFNVIACEKVVMGVLWSVVGAEGEVQNDVEWSPRRLTLKNNRATRYVCGTLCVGVLAQQGDTYFLHRLLVEVIARSGHLQIGS